MTRLSYLIISTLLIILMVACLHIADLTRDRQELTDRLIYVLNVLERVHQEKVERGERLSELTGVEW